MKMDRRSFFKMAGGALATSLVLGEGQAAAGRVPPIPADQYACLVDLSKCVGCRKCEQACNQVNGLPEPEVSFDDLTVLDRKRRPDERAFTVVNRYWTGRRDERNQLIPSFVKVQCMHCQDPACVSACIVGALTKKANGAVHYDVSKCIGCRYCMVACPFQIPAYEYHDPLTPRVMKCTFCYDRIAKEGGKPGCASICPTEAITFGKRSALLELAHQKLEADPGRYRQQVYGEFEVGGTCWLYITNEPFEKLGFLTLPSYPMPHLAETIQHGIFAYLWAPLTLFGLLAGSMAIFNRKELKGQAEKLPAKEEEQS